MTHPTSTSPSYLSSHYLDGKPTSHSPFVSASPPTLPTDRTRHSETAFHPKSASRPRPNSFRLLPARAVSPVQGSLVDRVVVPMVWWRYLKGYSAGPRQRWRLARGIAGGRLGIRMGRGRGWVFGIVVMEPAGRVRCERSCWGLGRRLGGIAGGLRGGRRSGSWERSGVYVSGWVGGNVSVRMKT